MSTNYEEPVPKRKERKRGFGFGRNQKLFSMIRDEKRIREGVVVSRGSVKHRKKTKKDLCR